MNRYAAVLIPLCILASSLAQNASPTAPQDVVTRPVERADEIARVVDAATAELLLVTDTFRNRQVADAVRRALVERGVRVFVIAPEALVTDLSSYFGTLERAGAAVRLREIGGAYLVADRRWVVQGPLLSELDAVPQAVPTMLIASEAYAAHLAGLFINAFEGGTPWMFEAR